MDVKVKRKVKKRRTRRNLNDLRKRSIKDMGNNINISNENKLKGIPKFYRNDLITCNRLTLFKKAVRSRTVTRSCFPKIDNSEKVDSNALTNIFTNLSPQPHNLMNGVSIKSKKDIEFESSNHLFKKYMCGIVPNDTNNVNVTSCSPSEIGLINLDVLEQSKSEHLSSNFTSGSNSETESVHCCYEKFMKELPVHLKEHYPALSTNFLNENIIYLKQNCKENYQDIETSLNDRESIIQNPMDYIQTGSSWGQSVQNKQSILFSNSSSPTTLSEIGSNTSDIFLNSPEYQYFPHKLNQ